MNSRHCGDKAAEQLVATVSTHCPVALHWACSVHASMEQLLLTSGVWMQVPSGVLELHVSMVHCGHIVVSAVCRCRVMQATSLPSSQFF